MKVAVIGATGTAGSRVVAKLEEEGIDTVLVSRSTGVDLITGLGLAQALAGVDVAIDASNAFPTDASVDLHTALTSATRNVVAACAEQQVKHLVFLSILRIEDPVFDDFPYFVAKRAQEAIVRAGAVGSTIVKSSKWHEFATNPAVVSFTDDEVLVQDWLIQPVAAETVAEVLVETALSDTPAPTREITGPGPIRLPELTARLLARRGDARLVRAVAPEPAALAEGVLLAPETAEAISPGVDIWLKTQNTPG